jgi:hypothetical protein
MHANHTNSLSLTFTTCIIVYLPFSYQFTVEVIIVYNLELPFNYFLTIGLTVELIIVYNLELPFNYHLTISLTVKFINQLQRMIYTDAWKTINNGIIKPTHVNESRSEPQVAGRTGSDTICNDPFVTSMNSEAQ